MCSDFMKLPSETDSKACYCTFIEATSNDSLSHSICIVCAQELWSSEGKFNFCHIH